MKNMIRNVLTSTALLAACAQFASAAEGGDMTGKGLAAIGAGLASSAARWASA